MVKTNQDVVIRIRADRCECIVVLGR